MAPLSRVMWRGVWVRAGLCNEDSETLRMNLAFVAAGAQSRWTESLSLCLLAFLFIPVFTLQLVKF